jgi:cytochrome c-type biogenesis protein
MYNLLSQMSSVLIEPFLIVANGFQTIPILFALLLGIVGALAPCQLTGNLSAMTLYGNRSIQQNMVWKEITAFLIGKVIAFSTLGLLVWVLGRGVESELTVYFPWLRKMIGPILIFVGLFMVGLFKFSWSFSLLRLPMGFNKKSPFASFLLGLSFSLGFCPTMFILFFVTLMPITFSSSYGFLLPSVFAIGTTLPLITLIIVIWFLGLSGVLLKKGRKLGTIIQKTAGGIMILIGVFDTITYWSF